MVSLGVMSAPSAELAEVARPLTASRTRAGLLQCVERGLASGELVAGTNAGVLATVFDSFLLGIATLARDGVASEQIGAAIDQVLRVWDSAANG